MILPVPVAVLLLEKEFCMTFCSCQCSGNYLENCVVHRRISISQLENIFSNVKSPLLSHLMWGRNVGSYYFEITSRAPI